MKNYEVFLKHILQETHFLLEEFRLTHPAIQWKKIAGLRDILIHGYFKVDNELVWQVL